MVTELPLRKLPNHTFTVAINESQLF